MPTVNLASDNGDYLLTKCKKRKADSKSMSELADWWLAIDFDISSTRGRRQER
jgi:hypothetical protein